MNSDLPQPWDQSLGFVFSVATQVRAAQACEVAQELGGAPFDQRSAFFSLPNDQAHELVDLEIRTGDDSSEP